MNKYNAFTNTFYLREKKDLLGFYKRVDFWVSLVALVFVVLSLTLNRYTNTTFSQMWTLTNTNWALALCGIFSIIAVVYVFAVNFLCRNNITLSGINIALGLLMVVFFIMEYIVLTRVGIDDGNGGTNLMSNSAAVGFYLGIIGGILVVGLEFYKLGVQGYYTASEVAEEKKESDVKVIDGVVVVDGEAITVSKNGNDTRVRVLTEGQVQEQAENDADKEVANTQLDEKQVSEEPSAKESLEVQAVQAVENKETKKTGTENKKTSAKPKSTKTSTSAKSSKTTSAKSSTSKTASTKSKNSSTKKK